MGLGLVTKEVERVEKEIIQYVSRTVGAQADKFYVQAVVTDSEEMSEGEGKDISLVGGGLQYVVVDKKLVPAASVATVPVLYGIETFIHPRIKNIYYLITGEGYECPVRFRWSVDTATGGVDREVTYYRELSEEEKDDDGYLYLPGRLAWEKQIRNALANN